MTECSHFQPTSTSSAKVGKMAKRPTCCFGCRSRTVTCRRIGSATLWIGPSIRIFSNMFWSCLWLYQARNLSRIKVLKIIVSKERHRMLTILPWRQAHLKFMQKNNDAKHENWCLLTSQQMLPIVFNHFNQAVRWLKKLINQTNQKRFSPNRTWKNSTNQTN